VHCRELQNQHPQFRFEPAKFSSARGSRTKIELRRNNFGDEGWGAVFKAICSNEDSKITTMDANGEGIRPAGAKLIAEALKTSVSGSLTRFNLT
jgi:hypothetical protein